MTFLTSGAKFIAPSVDIDKSSDLGFAQVLALTVIFLIVFLFAAATHYGIFFLIAIAASGLSLSFVILNRRVEYILLYSLLFVVGFNATYLPLFGMFSAFEGQPTILLRYALGVRSAWFVVAMLIATLVVVYRYREAVHKLARPLVIALISLVASSIFSGAGLDAIFTYLLNSFVPLFLTLFCLGAILSLPALSAHDTKVLGRIVVVYSLLATIYFLVLPYTYDIFRPDLASFLRARPGEYIPKGSYDISWGTKIFGYEITRLVGTFPDPIIAGYFFSATAFAFYVAKKHLAFLVLSVLLIFTFSKGAWLFYFQAIVLYWIGNHRKYLIVPTAILLLCTQLGLAAYLDASNRMHYLGLVGGTMSVFRADIKSLSIGFGVGDGGNLGRSSLVGGAFDAGWLGSGSESGIGVLVHQLGMLGLIALLASAFAFWKHSGFSLPSIKGSDDMALISGIRSLGLSLVLNMPLQENCINSSVLSSVLLGAVLLRGFLSYPNSSSNRQVVPSGNYQPQ